MELLLHFGVPGILFWLPQVLFWFSREALGAPRAPGDSSGEPSGGSSGSLVGHFGVEGVPRGVRGAPQEGPVQILQKIGA